jgi:hypothetical protein
MSRGATRVAVLAVLLTTGIVSLLALLQSGTSHARRDVRSRAAPGLRPPFVMFRTLAPPEGHGRVAVLSLRTRDATRQVAGLSCLRLHYAGGRGLCVLQDTVENPPTYAAVVFDASFTPRIRFPLSGVPTRVRVAPNGSRAAITTYGEEERPEGERLATTSVVVDLESGRVLADLREFQLDGGSLLSARGEEPRDFSSVTFERDSDRFFATLTTSGERFLVAGSVDRRRLSVIRAGVASEALSPDGQRLAIKRLVGERGSWQLGVIDLRDSSTHEVRQGPPSVDDQVEWWDDGHLLYHDADGETTSIWILPVKGDRGPRVAIRDAYSAAVQR